MSRGRLSYTTSWDTIIAPSTYYDVVAERTDVNRLSGRAGRDIATKVEIRRMFNENIQVYGARKIWRQLNEKVTISPAAPSLGL